jgi:hypothetical protein
MVAEEGKTYGIDDARPSRCSGAGAALGVRGLVVASPAKGQVLEVTALHVEVIGAVYGEEHGEIGGKLYPRTLQEERNTRWTFLGAKNSLHYK